MVDFGVYLLAVKVYCPVVNVVTIFSGDDEIASQVGFTAISDLFAGVSRHFPWNQKEKKTNDSFRSIRRTQKIGDDMNITHL